MLVGADLGVPAAVDQLRTLGRQVDVILVYSDDEAARSGTGDPVSMARREPGRGSSTGQGRPHRGHRRATGHRRRDDGPGPPDPRGGGAEHTFLVVDAMTGQDAVTVAEAFHETLELDGVILSDSTVTRAAVRRCPSKR